MLPRSASAAFAAIAALALSACTYRKGADPTPPPGEEEPPPVTGPVEPAPPEPRLPWARRSVYYEIFVRSFQDSNGDGKGDLRGLLQRLDYLNDGDPSGGSDLGVDVLWLMPVFRSPSYHGYDTTDYRDINPDYGTLADFQALASEAHRRGMKIILDLMINHTGVGHPWFQESASSASSPRRDWYVWSGSDPGWRQPWNPFGSTSTWYPRNGAYYYGLFWSGMPDLNLRTPAVRQEMKDIAAFWLAQGADGFRLDAARYLIETGGGGGQADTQETHQFWKEFAAAVRAVRPDAALVGENWADLAVIRTYYGSTAAVPGGDELQLNFNFPLAFAITDGVKASSAAGISSVLSQVKSTYPAGATDAPFLRNHDLTRVATELGNSPGRLANAAAILLTVPGAPFLYYGEEIGMQNGAGGADEYKRTPMPWDGSAGGGFTTGTPWFPFAPGHGTANVAAQRDVAGSLLARYRRLIAVRKSSDALSQGSITLHGAGASSVLAFVRASGPERVLVLHNLGDSGATVGPLDVAAAGGTTLFADPGVSDLGGSSGALRATLSARGTGIYALR
jgi:glycosidase